MEHEKSEIESGTLFQPTMLRPSDGHSHCAADLCPISLQVPLQDNDGVPFGPELLSVVNLLDQRFGGVTVFRECVGAWHGLQEPSWRLEVAVSRERVEEVIEAGVSIGRRLGQRAVYISVGLPTVRIIEINGLEFVHEEAGECDDRRGTNVVVSTGRSR